MDSRRQLKVGSIIQEAFTEILNREGKSIFGKAFVTLTRVKLTSDLGLARFYLSVYNSENPDEVIDKLNEHKSELRKKLNEKLRNQMRIMPEIEFFRDETLEYAFHMEEVFKKIREQDETLKSEVRSQKSEVKSITKKAAAKNPKSKIRNPK